MIRKSLLASVAVQFTQTPTPPGTAHGRNTAPSPAELEVYERQVVGVGRNRGAGGAVRGEHGRAGAPLRVRRDPMLQSAEQWSTPGAAGHGQAEPAESDGLCVSGVLQADFEGDGGDLAAVRGGHGGGERVLAARCVGRRARRGRRG